MDSDELRAPPLRPDLQVTWHRYLDAWASGQRRTALVTVEELVAALDRGESTERERFALWLCERLFDDSNGWRGQFGGGLTATEHGWQRPIDWALSTHPLATRVVIPYVVAVSRSGQSGRPLRWLYQSLVGVSFRLTAPVRDELEATLQAVCGPEALPADALREAAADDEVARQWFEAL